ncbi:hypothetical protein L210DRAFT_3758434 [Boletus edulis BED1]|uniref:RNA-binding domain-containing protein n=1 Tax=Boletus edulis BED1 TaxID=1328754 RepID=A0AAD4C2L7_BOLED|nr:hypothetical protein L210DRAFT_3758434 [Boletus edulis BED1]
MGPKTRTATEWSLADDDFDTAMGPATTHETENGAGDGQLDDAGQAAELATGKSYEDTHGAKGEPSRDRPVKANKIYIGGLPDHIRPEDLRSCFGKIGDIVTVELKLGYGFVEFESKEAAEESVARYHEGYFMGNKIRVELSHSRGRSYKRSDDPGACFRCGEGGHWARECPRPNTQSRSGGSVYDQPSHDRGHSARDYHHHSSRDGHSYRDEYSRHSNSRDDRFYDTPAAPPPARDHRRAPTPPPRDRRDDPPPRREHDEYPMRSPPPPQPASRHERTRHGSEREYSSNGAPDRDSYDRYERRPAAHSDDRSAPYPAHGGRPRTPPGPPPSWRDDSYDKAPRGHHHTQETRRRPVTSPAPYPGSSANGSRPRRRSLSPSARYDSRYAGQTHTDGDRYSGPSRENPRVRDYHRNRAEDSGHRRS